MGAEGTSRPCGALQSLRGVHLMQHSPFAVQEIHQNEDCNLSSSERSQINVWDGFPPQALPQDPCLYSAWSSASPAPSCWKAWQQRPSCLRPVHCSLHGDQILSETIANVLTSLPFIALGIHAPRKNLNAAIYANSLIGVGVASSLYHISRGEIRKYLRWADYTMIATTTVCLLRALRNENPKLLMAASALFLPVQPLMVSAVHTGFLEVAFAKRALTKPELRMAHNLHTLSSLLGGALFIADDVFPETPYLHAAWHLAATIGVGTCNKLLE